MFVFVCKILFIHFLIGHEILQCANIKIRIIQASYIWNAPRKILIYLHFSFIFFPLVVFIKSNLLGRIKSIFVFYRLTPTLISRVHLKTSYDYLYSYSWFTLVRLLCLPYQYHYYSADPFVSDIIIVGTSIQNSRIGSKWENKHRDNKKQTRLYCPKLVKPFNGCDLSLEIKSRIENITVVDYDALKRKKRNEKSWHPD